MRAAALQLNSTHDTARNLETADRLVRAAAADGADLVLLPEKWTVLGSEEGLRAGAQTFDGPAVRWARAIAHELGIDLIAGSIAERIEGTDRLANTSLHIGPEGDIHAAYRKIHLFDVEVDGVAYRESDTDDAGDEVVITHAADGTAVGMSICYDLRFPELYAALAIGGAQVIVVPSAFTLATTRDHWEVLLRARAIECQCFIVAANQTGADGAGRRCGGRSMIIDPWGVVRAGAADEVSHCVAELDLQKVDDVRRRIPSLQARRPNVYGALAVR